MSSRDGRHWLVYNGEIYNHAELRRQLSAQGVAFRSASDTEVLLEWLLRYGPEGLVSYEACSRLPSGTSANTRWSSRVIASA